MNKPMFELAGSVCPCLHWLLLTSKFLQTPEPVMILDGLVASADSDHHPRGTGADLAYGVLGMSPRHSYASELNLPLIPLYLIFINRLLPWFLILCSSSLYD